MDYSRTNRNLSSRYHLLDPGTPETKNRQHLYSGRPALFDGGTRCQIKSSLNCNDQNKSKIDVASILVVCRSYIDGIWWYKGDNNQDPSKRQRIITPNSTGEDLLSQYSQKAVGWAEATSPSKPMPNIKTQGIPLL